MLISRAATSIGNRCVGICVGFEVFDAYKLSAKCWVSYIKWDDIAILCSSSNCFGSQVKVNELQQKLLEAQNGGSVKVAVKGGRGVRTALDPTGRTVPFENCAGK